MNFIILKEVLKIKKSTIGNNQLNMFDKKRHTSKPYYYII